MEEIILTASFVFGTIIGSLSGVILERTQRGEDYVYKPSYCTSCSTRLKFYHNIPILSWLFLGGKCGFCGSRIPVRLFLIELLIGLLFLFCGYFILERI